MKQKSINGLAWSVMWRIIVVIAYYILLILLSVLIIIAVYYFSVHIFWQLVPNLRSIYVVIMAIVAWAGLCCLALMFAAFLVKPLFSSTESTEVDNTVEIEGEDCPELFDAISDVVKQTGTKMPKHVYLSPDTNACVFFDSSFWSIFLPIRKNLKIGLGLFNGLSVEELKSILAHEFGHFSQGSMKVGSSVYVINQVLYNMTYERDGWDDLLESWSTTDSDNWIANAFAFWGVLTRRMTNWVKRGNELMYKYVRQAYMSLSRQMEFDADNISCKCVGKECFISAMYKTDINSRNLRFFADIMKDLIADKKKVPNIFEAIEITNNTYFYDDPTLISYDQPLEESLILESRIRVNDTWSSHPLLEDRIENAKNNPSKEVTTPISAWSLVPKNIAIQVSETFYWAYEDYMKCQEFSNEDYASWLNQYLPQHYMPNHFRQFFGRRISSFDLSGSSVDNVEYPFTQQNRMIVDEYLVTHRDWGVIESIQNHEIDTKDLYINGEPLTALDFPIDEYKKHLSVLSPKIYDLDRQVYQYLSSHCQEEMKNQLDSSYNLLFYAYNTIDGCLSSLMNVSNQTRDKLVGIFNAFGGFHADAVYDIVEKYVINFNKHLQGIDPNAVTLITDRGYLVDLQGELAAYTEIENLSKTDYLNRILVSLPQELIDIHKMLIFKAQKSLSEIAQDICNRYRRVEDNSIPPSSPLSNKIEPVTIDKLDDTVSPVVISGLVTTLFILSIVIIISLLCPRKVEIPLESEQVIETSSILKPISDSETYISVKIDDPVELMRMERDLTKLSLIADTATNTRIRFFIPDGLSYRRVYAPDGTILNGFYISDNESFPTYKVFIYTKHFYGAFEEDEIKKIISEYEKSNDLIGVSHTSESSMRRFDQSTFCYIIKHKYDTDSQLLVDYYVLHPSGDNYLAYVIYERAKETPNPVVLILRTMVFKQYDE